MKNTSLSPKKVIKNQVPSWQVYCKEIWHYRSLLRTLTFRDLKVRYAQTSLGLLWVFIQPLITLLIFTLVFNIAIKIDTQGIPYPIFAFSGLYAWHYFSLVVNQGGVAILNAHSLVTKIYFPRIILPLSKALVVAVDFLINVLLMAGVMLYYAYTPHKNLIYFPLWLIALLVASLGCAIGLSALSVRFRDFQPISRFGLQVGFYLTPIAYPPTLIPVQYHLLYYSNPMAGITEGFRWMIIGGKLSPYVGMSLGVAVGIFILSGWYFRKTERLLADIV
ncbi:ABC transporter permease [uncultured Microscilla sp.]|uniref:ABC transporter permease n=1 Tax=uncultured Microscilla sp. TaxID=432653 RepID=UPI0026346CB0|nr:ABC transporter permease [uncultured Microscilla sp.]